MTIDFAHIRSSASWLSAAFLLTFASGFGQTFFISLFGGHIRDEFGLSHGQFGQIYLLGTVASAMSLVWLGKTADRFRVISLGLVAMAALAVAAAAMAVAVHPVTLVVAIFGLRLFGQGMLTHISVTAVARWFERDRGKALSIAGLGHPLGEALLPSLVVVLIAALGWRTTWLAMAACLVLVIAPVFALMLAGKPASPRDRDACPAAPTRHKTQWDRRAVLRSPLFWLLMPGLLAPPFIGTGVIFHQAHLVEIKGWSLSFFAASFAAYPAASVLATFAAGILVDRFSARSLLPFYLLPMAASLVVLAATTAHYAAPASMALLGLTAGAAATLLGAIWAELYGTAHVGSVRSLVVAQMVFSTALAPGIMGWLIDVGVPLETQLLVMAAYVLAVAALFLVLQARLRETAEG